MDSRVVQEAQASPKWSDLTFVPKDNRTRDGGGLTCWPDDSGSTSTAEAPGQRQQFEDKVLGKPLVFPEHKPERAAASNKETLISLLKLMNLSLLAGSKFMLHHFLFPTGYH